MVISKMVLIKSELVANVDLISIGVVIATVFSALAMYFNISWLSLSFLYVRPELFLLRGTDIPDRDDKPLAHYMQT